MLYISSIYLRYFHNLSGLWHILIDNLSILDVDFLKISFWVVLIKYVCIVNNFLIAILFQICNVCCAGSFRCFLTVAPFKMPLTCNFFWNWLFLEFLSFRMSFLFYIFLSDLYYFGCVWCFWCLIDKKHSKWIHNDRNQAQK